MLRRIPRIICTHCGRARTTTWHGWHYCTEGHDIAPGQAAGVAAVSAAMLLIVLASALWALIRFWP